MLMMLAPWSAANRIASAMAVDGAPPVLVNTFSGMMRLYQLAPTIPIPLVDVVEDVRLGKIDFLELGEPGGGRGH